MIQITTKVQRMVYTEVCQNVLAELMTSKELVNDALFYTLLQLPRTLNMLIGSITDVCQNFTNFQK